MARDEMLTIGEVARLTKAGKSTVYRWIKAGLLGRVDLGTGRSSKTRIPQSELDRFFASRTIAARKPRGRAA
jgi:excisionase family DNA binding protein